jgi:hypothetical protein
LELSQGKQPALIKLSALFILRLEGNGIATFLTEEPGVVLNNGSIFFFQVEDSIDIIDVKCLMNLSEVDIGPFLSLAYLFYYILVGCRYVLDDFLDES